MFMREMTKERPLTHDLMAHLMTAVGAHVERVIINDLKNATYYARMIIAAENEAFRDHWGHREMTESTYRQTYDRPELDTDLWVVAWSDDEIAGVVQNWIWPEENERLGVKRGWLEHISVRRPWRRQGLARAITAASLVRLREAGMEDAMLGVDSENANGALGLYESLGFDIASRASAYRRDLRR